MENTKKSYFENINSKKITENRSCWRTVLPLFTQNPSKGEKTKAKALDSTFHFRKNSCNRCFCIDEGGFPSELKQVDTVPIHKNKMIRVAKVQLTFSNSNPKGEKSFFEL